MTLHKDVWQKGRIQQIRIAGWGMFLFFIIVQSIIQLNAVKMFLIEFFCVSVYVGVIDIVDNKRNRKLLEHRILQVLRKYTDLQDVHDILKACIREYDYPYAHDEIEKTLAILAKQRIEIPASYKITLKKSKK